MDSLLRLILRIFLVPLGIAIAVLVAVCVLAVSEWNAFLAYMNANPDAQGGYILALVLMGPWVMIVIAGTAIQVLAPAAIGILIAEFFAIRSFLFHTANGVIAAWVGWTLINPPKAEQQFFSDPKLVIVMGLAAGFTYWLIAGWGSGFWRPVSKQSGPPPVAVPPPASPVASAPQQLPPSQLPPSQSAS